jgi:peptidoglycan-associated lipoprotein
MKVRKTLSLAILSVALLALAGCSGPLIKSKAKGATVPAPVEDATQAQTAGAGNEMNFSEEGANAERTKAPADQTYHFEYNKYDVQEEDVAAINAQGKYLAEHTQAKVRLEGNADERGSREYNIALGWKRAKAVAAILKQQGVAASQIAMLSYGKEKPLVADHDEGAYKLNRRTELVYEKR